MEEEIKQEIQFAKDITHYVTTLKSRILDQETYLRKTKEKIFKTAPEFKTWIEQTSLFDAIKKDAVYKGTVRTHKEDGSIDMELDLNGVIIEVAEDLPIELIVQFYNNYPNKQDKRLLV